MKNWDEWTFEDPVPEAPDEAEDLLQSWLVDWPHRLSKVDTGRESSRPDLVARVRWMRNLALRAGRDAVFDAQMELLERSLGGPWDKPS